MVSPATKQRACLSCSLGLPTSLTHCHHSFKGSLASFLPATDLFWLAEPGLRNFAGSPTSQYHQDCAGSHVIAQGCPRDAKTNKHKSKCGCFRWTFSSTCQKSSLHLKPLWPRGCRSVCQSYTVWWFNCSHPTISKTQISSCKFASSYYIHFFNYIPE